MTTEPALDRRQAVATLLKDRGDLLVVSGLGSPSYDVHAAGDHDANYYLWGAMGAAALIGLGLAQARPDRIVAAITGDGEQLMGLGGLATIAVAKPKNLVVIVIDNGHFGETGMQMSHTGRGIELARIAEACGIEATIARRPADLEAMRAGLRRMGTGPRLFVVKVKAEAVPRSLPIRDAVHLKNRLRGHLGLSPN
ncbi:Thiamine pyrophosphate enzyme, C-terminal TPP binding domain [Rhizobiales bacterium GAS113]|nr:Thiamine pyrophosphate enzyme, C-terminal TPP binding domain [Rhizobiales bacterium GAS113]